MSWISYFAPTDKLTFNTIEWISCLVIDRHSPVGSWRRTKLTHPTIGCYYRNYSFMELSPAAKTATVTPVVVVVQQKVFHVTEWLVKLSNDLLYRESIPIPRPQTKVRENIAPSHTHQKKFTDGNHRNVTHNFKLTPTSSRPTFSAREQTQSHHTHGGDDGAPLCDLPTQICQHFFFFNARSVISKNFLASAPANLSLRRNPTNRDETDSREKSSHFGPHHRLQIGGVGRQVEGSALLFAGPILHCGSGSHFYRRWSSFTYRSFLLWIAVNVFGVTTVDVNGDLNAEICQKEEFRRTIGNFKVHQLTKTPYNSLILPLYKNMVNRSDWRTGCRLSIPA